MIPKSGRSEHALGSGIATAAVATRVGRSLLNQRLRDGDHIAPRPAILGSRACGGDWRVGREPEMERDMKLPHRRLVAIAMLASGLGISVSAGAQEIAPIDGRDVVRPSTLPTPPIPARDQTPAKRATRNPAVIRPPIPGRPPAPAIRPTIRAAASRPAAASPPRTAGRMASRPPTNPRRTPVHWCRTTAVTSNPSPAIWVGRALARYLVHLRRPLRAAIHRSTRRTHLRRQTGRSSSQSDLV
jgi:hypothetical protein